MSTSTSGASLFELDGELNLLLDEIQEQAEEAGEANVSPELISRFQEFCLAFDRKVDRIGRFLISLNARAEHCRGEAARLSERARAAENKAARTKQMVLYFLAGRGLKKVEGLEVSLRRQKNGQDSVIIHSESSIPIEYREIEVKIPGSFWQQLQGRISEADKQELNTCVRHSTPSPSAIKAAGLINIVVPGTEIRREHHLRIE
jgi:hypothetical protein